ncbi:Uncharacterized protein TCM_019769 [Theobroma cacao]|uniref:Uncharacterized protein n=1 Tax=Theobroma cacao TaxID=3641 RepID=A0A061EI35_THECC|nr:Uncharacterized protein TCM_019769 [Theobroma cacao]
MNPMAALGGILPLPAPANAYTPPTNPIVVIGEQFLAPYPVELKIQQKIFTLAENNFDVTDVNGSLIFKVKGKLFSIRDRRILLDAVGNPLVSLKQKSGAFNFVGDCMPGVLYGRVVSKVGVSKAVIVANNPFLFGLGARQHPEIE